MHNNDIVGQSTLLDGLKSIVLGGRVVHSYIFTGDLGIGKRTISNFFSKLLLCGGSDKPCNRCKFCMQVDSDNEPDLIRIKSDKSVIRVDDIREIKKSIGIKPFQGSRKIYIIEDGELMNQQAQNAFLKTLEEPPSHAVIIILATNLNSLFPTIISRCQHIRIPRLTTGEITGIIESRLKIPREKAQIFARLSEGVPGRGLKLAGSQEYQAIRDESFELIRDLSEKSLGESLDSFDFFLNNKDNITEILDLISLWFRDIIILKEGVNRNLVANLDKITELKSLAESFTIPDLQCIIENIEESRGMLKSHANFQLTVENMLMKIQGSGKHAGGSRGTI